MRIRFLFFLIILALIPFAQAAEVTLAWNASITPEVQGYAIFSRDYTKPYNYDQPAWEGAQLTCTLTVRDDRQTAFVARAFVWGPYDLQGNRIKIWSDDSNEVVFTPAIQKPAPPRNFMQRILQAILDFFGGLSGSFSKLKASRA